MQKKFLLKASGTGSTIIWSRKTSQGNQWRYGQVYTSSIGNFQFAIEGIVRRMKYKNIKYSIR